MCQAAFTFLSMLFYQNILHTMMLPHRDKWDAHYSTIDETVYIGRDVFVVVSCTWMPLSAVVCTDT